MDKNEAVGVLKTLIDFNDSDYIKEALEMSIKSLQAPESAQTAHNKASMQCRHNYNWSSISKVGYCNKCGARSE